LWNLRPNRLKPLPLAEEQYRGKIKLFRNRVVWLAACITFRRKSVSARSDLAGEVAML